MGMCCKKKSMIGCEEEGARPRGRPKKTWTEIVKKDCQARKLNREDAMDHSILSENSFTSPKIVIKGCICICKGLIHITV